MEVKRYIFQSPYPSPVQVGRPDPTAQQSQDAELMQQSNQTLQKAQATKQSMTQEVQPKVQSPLSTQLDLYV